MASVSFQSLGFFLRPYCSFPVHIVVEMLFFSLFALGFLFSGCIKKVKGDSGEVVSLAKQSFVEGDV